MYKLRLLKADYLTHDVKRFLFEKPDGFVYRPGQSARVSVNKPGWEDKVRPFAFTSLGIWPEVEFIVKIRDERDGVSAQLGLLKPGDEILIHDVFGTIEYKGPGIFIAGGTGITPFIAIFRALFYSGNLRDVALLYSNKSQDDIVLRDELVKMLGPAYMNVFTRQGVIGFRERKIDKKFLIENIGDFGHRFYVCGPKSFTEDISQALISLGVDPKTLII